MKKDLNGNEWPAEITRSYHPVFEGVGSAEMCLAPWGRNCPSLNHDQRFDSWIAAAAHAESKGAKS